MSAKSGDRWVFSAKVEWPQRPGRLGRRWGDPLHAYGDQALSAFDLDFLDGGQRRRTALGAGWNVRFEDVPPVRGFRWNKGSRSFPGWYYAVTTRDHVGYESWLERDRLILLDFDPDVVGIASQPFWLHWRNGGAKRRHAPDYFVRLADGRARIVDVRAEDCHVCWHRRHGSARQRGRRAWGCNGDSLVAWFVAAFT